MSHFYGIRGDIKAILSELPSDSRELNFANISVLANKLSCEAQEVKWDIDAIQKSYVPAILLLKNGESVIYFPESLNVNQLYKPGFGYLEETLEKIFDLYNGKSILFLPPKDTVQAKVDHMVRGFSIDWFWEPIRQNWQSYTDIIICSLFINILVLVLPVYTMNVYDRVISNYAISTLIALTVGVVFALFFDFGFKMTRSYILEKLAANIGSKYDTDLMERLLRIKPYFMNMSVGERANIFRELQGIRDFFAARFMPMVVDLPFFILFCGVIYLISPAIAWVPIAGTIIIFVVNILGRVSVNRATKKYFSSMQAKTTLMIETLSGASTIQKFNAIGSRLFKWRLAAARSSEAASVNHIIVSLISNLSFLVASLVNVFVVFFGVYQIIDNNLTIGGLLACTILSGRAMAPVMSSSGTFSQLRQSLDVLLTIDNLFKLPYEKSSLKDVGFKGDIKGDITLKSVTVKYPYQENEALSKASLSIKAGEHVGIIGRTGAGKSTLVKVISGELPIEDGQIFFDDYNQGMIPATEMRRIISTVPQEAFLFSGSILDNVLLGETVTDDDLLKKAIHYSGLDLVMQQTGNGLDTEVGEGGARLSGGQRQSISLARAFLRNPDILIFDEPTTGMDSILESRLKSFMLEFIKEKTFIMITHRTSLLSLVDRLILVDKGKIIADGPRDEIIKMIAAQS